MHLVGFSILGVRVRVAWVEFTRSRKKIAQRLAVGLNW